MSVRVGQGLVPLPFPGNPAHNYDREGAVKKILVSMLIGFGDSQQSVDFEVRVPEDWDPSAENIGAICQEFRREAILDVEDVCCDGCGYSVMEGICECDEEDVA